MVTQQVVAVRLIALGVPVDVHLTGAGAAEAAAAVTGAWGWCLRPPGVVVGADVLVVRALLDPSGGEVPADGVAAFASLPVLMDWLSPAVTTAAITHLAGQRLMLHACALADPVTGATVALVGRSGMGKTTLSRTLGRSFGYVTDETVAVQADGAVLAYPKPLSVRWSPDDAVKEQVPPGRLGLLEPPSTLRLAAVVLLDRQVDGPAVPEFSSVPLVFALSLLAEQCSYLTQMDQPLQQLAALARGVGGVRQVTYREAGDLAPVLRSLLEMAP